MKKILILCSLLSVAAVGTAQTSRINFEAPGVYPEGTAWDEAGQRFFVSSATRATIGTVTPDGVYKPFFQDSSLKSSFGMKVDGQRNLLLICTGDPKYSMYKDSATFKKMIRLIGIDLKSGKKTLDVDLSAIYQGKHFANDLCLDDKGNVYITDSYSPAIYKVDVNGKASLFVTSDLFKGFDIGLNGIVYHPNGYLLAVNNNNGSILKIDVLNSSMIQTVMTDNFFPGADGLLLDKNNNLILVQNKGVNKIFMLQSKDDFKTAVIVAATSTEDRFAQPSTATYQGDKLYVLNSKLNELNDPTLPPSKEFSLQVAELKPL
ncbi:gluconolaconase [Foetidibacter luteolus]|uniref:gluconolaconase n=1 Tax=Foetidibacter luteolus TaxID=2608880 RepID=UPI00129BCAE1|nr:gluconolaconase [Foetidibacter luteolus]